jgi:hypothetical protein
MELRPQRIGGGMDGDAFERPVVLAPEGRALRRVLGPTPWVALEVLAAQSHHADGCVVADISVRGLAAELGVAKDTAARALATLRAKGVIAPRQSRTPLGRYATGSYVIAKTDLFAIAQRADSAPSMLSQAIRASKPRRLPTISSTQLSLLEAD